MACLDSQSITTRMVVKPDEEGSCLMKSIKMEFHGQCHTPNTFGTVNMEHTIDSSLSWSE